MQSARDILKLFVAGQIDEWAVIEWGRELHYAKLAEVINAPYADRKAKIESILASIAAPNETLIAERYRAIELIKKVLSQTAKPIVLSTWVNQLDGRMSSEDVYPDWLSDLWNALDWCDKDWSLSNQPHLELALTNIHIALTALDHEA